MDLQLVGFERYYDNLMLPGPPNELKMMMQKEVLPYVEKVGKVVYSNLGIRFFGIGSLD